MKREPRHVVIAGGGITGLSAAFYLRKLCRERDIPLRLTVVERAQTLGGKIRTLRRDGHVIERGPDSFLARKTAILDLTRELGLEPELVPTRPEAGVSYILRGGELHRMPGGSMLGIPTKLKPFLQSGLVSPAGKARAALDLILPSRKESGDESLGAFFRRRLGDEVTETLVEPILAGIYSGDLDRLSLQATYPMFHEVERRYRSVIRGLKRGGLQQTAQPNAAPPLPEHLRRSLFLSYKDGLSALVEKLENALSDASLVSGEEIVRVSSSPEGLTLEAASGTAYRADAAVLAVPAFALGKLLPNLPAAQAFARTPYVSVANVVFGRALPLRRFGVRDPAPGRPFHHGMHLDFVEVGPYRTGRPHAHPVLRRTGGRPGVDVAGRRNDHRRREAGIAGTDGNPGGAGSGGADQVDAVDAPV